MPLFLLIYLIVSGTSVPKALVQSTLATIVVSMLFGRIGPKQIAKHIVSALAAGIKRIVPIAGACASAGLIVGLISLTALGSKIRDLIPLASKNNLLMTLALTAIISLLMSMRLPTTLVYVIVSVLLYPALVRMGVPLLLAAPLRLLLRDAVIPDTDSRA